MPSAQDLTEQNRAWSQIDHQLISLKLTQAAGEMANKYAQRKQGYLSGELGDVFAAMIRVHIDWAKESAERTFEICTDVWEAQGKTKTPAFLRAVLNNRLLPAIEARVGVAGFEITNLARIKRNLAGLGSLLQTLAADANRLKGEWRRKIEIGARELELKQGRTSVETPLCSSPTDATKGDAGGIRHGEPYDDKIVHLTAKIGELIRPVQGQQSAEEITRASDQPSFTNSEHYTSVTICGQHFSLTSRQAQFIEILHRARESGNPEVSFHSILEQLGTQNSRWQDTWKSNREARKALIKSGLRKGTLRLNL
jgi:hypothetical protein